MCDLYQGDTLPCGEVRQAKHRFDASHGGVGDGENLEIAVGLVLEKNTQAPANCGFDEGGLDCNEDSRWIGEVGNPEHPAHALFEQIKDRVAGASCGCADVFGATKDVEKSGFDLIKDNPVPGTSGLPSLRKLVADGYTVLTF